MRDAGKDIVVTEASVNDDEDDGESHEQFVRELAEFCPVCLRKYAMERFRSFCPCSTRRYST